MNQQSDKLLQQIPKAAIAARLRIILATTAAPWFGSAPVQLPPTNAARGLGELEHTLARHRQS